MEKFCRRIAVVLKVLKNLVLFSGGRLSGQLRIQSSFNDMEGMMRKRQEQID
jgi:NADPH-dependent FMN reductase family protein